MAWIGFLRNLASPANYLNWVRFRTLVVMLS
jgi:hypothetical protein